MSDRRFLAPGGGSYEFGSSNSLASDRLPSIASSAASSRRGSNASLAPSPAASPPHSPAPTLPQIRLDQQNLTTVPPLGMTRSRSLSRQGIPIEAIPKVSLSASLSTGCPAGPPSGGLRRASLQPSHSLSASYRSLASSNESIGRPATPLSGRPLSPIPGRRDSRPATPRALGFRKIAPIVQTLNRSLSQVKAVLRGRGKAEGEEEDFGGVFAAFESLEELRGTTVREPKEHDHKLERRLSAPSLIDADAVDRLTKRKLVIKPNRRWMLFRNGLRGVTDLAKSHQRDDCELRGLHSDRAELSLQVAAKNDIVVRPSVPALNRPDGRGAMSGGARRGKYFPSLDAKDDAQEINCIIEEYLFGSSQANL